MKLTPRTLDQVVEVFPSYRQSLLAVMDNCSLSARFGLEGHSFTNAQQARGIIFHRYAAEDLRTRWRTGEQTIPPEEALQILYEVSRQENIEPESIVMVPARERRLLRICVLKMCSQILNLTGLINVEEQLETVLKYNRRGGGTTYRKITGRPDALLADAPNGAIVVDHKTAPSAPAAIPKFEGTMPTEEQAHWTGDHLHVSYEGYFQQRCYALLVMRNFPSVEHVTLREWYVLPNEVRQATVPREALDTIEEELCILCGLLDRGLEEGDSMLWSPSPGTHCAYCPKPQACPIEREVRAAQGGITSQTQAERIAAEVAVGEQVRKEGIAALKGWHESTGLPVPVKNAKGRSEWRWVKQGEGRRFKVVPPDESDRGPEDPQLKKAFAEAAERRTAA